MSTQFSNPAPTDQESIDAIIARLSALPGAMLPILHEIQHRFGHVPDGAVPAIAAALKLSRAEVHGVLTFYHQFRRTLPGRHVIQICRAEACQARGAAQLIEHAKRMLGVDFHETTADGAVTLEPVYCLGHCACGPAMQVDGKGVAAVDAVCFDECLATFGSAQ